jgi:hypothetical protein
MNRYGTRVNGFFSLNFKTSGPHFFKKMYTRQKKTAVSNRLDGNGFCWLKKKFWYHEVSGGFSFASTVDSNF